MGDFRIVINGTGGHGCQRDIKGGQKVFGCQQMHCPDCMARAFVEDLSRKMQVKDATFTHWPNTPQVVHDDLKSGIRTGSF